MQTKIIKQWAAAATLACITLNLNAQTFINDTSFTGASSTVIGGTTVIDMGSGHYYAPSTHTTSVGASLYTGVYSTPFDGRQLLLLAAQGNAYRAFDSIPAPYTAPFTLNSLQANHGISIEINMVYADPNRREFDFGLFGYGSNAAGSNTALAISYTGDVGTSVVLNRTGSDNLPTGDRTSDTLGTFTGGTIINTSTGKHTLVLNVIKLDSGMFQIEYKVDGVDQLLTNGVAFTDALTATKDTVITGLGFRNPGYNVGIDSLTVSLIPEPSTWMLLTGSVVLLAALRRRK